MADLLNIIETIGKLVKKIKVAVKKADQNVEDCRKIEMLMVTVGNIVKDNQAIKEEENKELSDTLTLLATALEEAYHLIDKCRTQNDKIVARAYNADDMSKHLQRAETDISISMNAVNFALAFDSNKLLRSLFQRFIIDDHQNGRTQRQQVQAAGLLVQTLHISDDSTYVATRSDNKSTRKNTKSDAASRSREKEDRLKASFARGRRSANFVAAAGLKLYSLTKLWGDDDAGFKDGSIGDGGTGTVYKQKIGNAEVAVKMFIQLDYIPPDVLLTKLRHEIDLLSTLEHKNIIKLLGCCYPNKDNNNINDGNFYLVSRYMPNGSLASIIDGTGGENCEAKEIDLASLVRIIQGIAEGIRYLHEQRVVHLDLKPSHILFDSDMTPKIMDFETARALDDDVDEIDVDSDKPPGTVGYMAPEQKEGIASTKSDVFSFGVILLEALLCICKPQSVLPGHSNTSGPVPIITEWINRVEQNDWMNVFDVTRVPGEYDLTVARSFLTVAFGCCVHDPASRPSMSNVVDLLHVAGSLITVKTNTDKEDNTTSDGRSEAKGKGKEQVAITNKVKKPAYKIFTEDELRTWLQKEKESIAKKLSMEGLTGVGEALLRHFKWTPNTVLREWTSNRKAVCDDVGLQWKDDKPVTLIFDYEVQLCDKCNQGVPAGEKWSAGCGHYYCKSCWTASISKNVAGMVHYYTMVGGPPRLSFLHCMASPSCKAPIVQNLVDQVANKEDKDVYGLYLLKSYVEDSGGRRMWCPKGCGRAIEIVERINNDVAMDVVCDCSHAFCWSCHKAPHQDVSSKCSDMDAW